MRNVLKLFALSMVLPIVFVGCKDDDEDLKAPQLGNAQVKYINETRAYIEAELISDGDEYVKDNGVCWNTEPTPTINDNSLETEDSDDLFTVELEDLTAETTYYVRAYATSEVGTSYSAEISFTTTSAITDADGNEYTTVQIGEQLWTGENLRVTTYNDGNAIPNVTNEDTWSDLTTPAYAWWENDPSESDRGAYYNYYTVETDKLCPTGWRVPTEDDWDLLLDYLGEEPGRKLKNHGSQLYTDYNETGFTAYMEGYRASGNGVFAKAGDWNWMWIGGGDAGSTYTYAKKFTKDSHGVSHDLNSKQMGFSIRCIKE
ncbi:MAG: FISUMP domain-containing protein [Salinivirgaceae bacterium]